ncbi:MspA family porin [Nocardia farcinica]|uniref:MspA family porin n=1 Tax=Nocardia farcinica TaxID=37329 RepID=UPI0002DFA7DC|nr:MspA family porin [Nocardia farcinica]
MKHKHSLILAAITAVMVAATGAVAVVDTAVGAAPGEFSSGGLRLIASVGSTNVVPADGDVVSGIPFVHAVTTSGEYSIDLDGASSLPGGQIVAGYLVGCAVNISNGISIGVPPKAGVIARVSPSFGLDSGIDLVIDAPPGISVGTGVGGGRTGGLAVNLAPGTVTAAVVGGVTLDENSTFPYTFAHSNTALNVGGCLSPVSAMPFVIVRADPTSGTVQTTGYGTEFAF